MYEISLCLGDVYFALSRDFLERLSREKERSDFLPETVEAIKLQIQEMNNLGGMAAIIKQREKNDSFGLRLYISTYSLELVPGERGKGYILSHIEPINWQDHRRLAKGVLRLQANCWYIVPTLSDIPLSQTNHWQQVQSSWHQLEALRKQPNSQQTQKQGLLTREYEAYLNATKLAIDFTQKLEQQKCSLEEGFPYTEIKSASEENYNAQDTYIFCLAGEKRPEIKARLRIRGADDLVGRVSSLDGNRLTMTFDKAIDRLRLDDQGILESVVSSTVYRRQREAIDMLREGDSCNPYLLRVLVDQKYESYQCKQITPQRELHPKQQEALSRALSVPDLLLILGPPGTGKTYTITEIAEWCSKQNLCLLITSKTHKAVDNVLKNLPAKLLVLRFGLEKNVLAETKSKLIDVQSREMQQSILEKTEQKFRFLSQFLKNKSQVDQSLGLAGQLAQTLVGSDQILVSLRQQRDFLRWQIEAPFKPNEDDLLFWIRDHEMEAMKLLRWGDHLERQRTAWIAYMRRSEASHASNSSRSQQASGISLTSQPIPSSFGYQQDNSSSEYRSMSQQVYLEQPKSISSHERYRSIITNIWQKIVLCFLACIVFLWTCAIKYTQSRLTNTQNFAKKYAIALRNCQEERERALSSHSNYQHCLRNIDAQLAVMKKATQDFEQQISHLRGLMGDSIQNQTQPEPHQIPHQYSLIEQLRKLSSDLEQQAYLLNEWREELQLRTEQLYPELARYADVVAATCIGIASAEVLSGVEFDLALVDEAGQICLTDLLVPLVRAKRAVLVGDHQQLPPYLDHEVKEWLNKPSSGIQHHSIFKSDETAQSWVHTMLTKSAFELLFTSCPSEENKVSFIEQRRMPKLVADFVAKHFYDQLDTAPAKVKQDLHFRDILFRLPLVFIDTSALPLERREEKSPISSKDDPEGWGKPGWRNPLEAKLIADIVRIFQHEGRKWLVIAPYKAQARSILEMLPELEGNEKLQERIATVDSFQGGQSDTVLYSFTRSNKLRGKKGSRVGFLKELRRLNVAMTRTERLLVLIGDMKTLTQTDDDNFNSLMRDLRLYVQQYGEWISYEAVLVRLQKMKVREMHNE